MNGKPYWTMSRVEVPGIGRYDWLYKQPPPKIPRKPKTAAIKKPKSPPEPTQSAPGEQVELVGYKPSEYRAVPSRAPLRGTTAPAEFGRRDIFADMHTPIQVTKKYNGSPILSVPIQSYSRLSKTRSRSIKPRNSFNEESAEIHDVLFEESVDPHEDIDPWGFSRDEKVEAPDKVLHGIKLTVSRLNQRPP